MITQAYYDEVRARVLLYNKAGGRTIRAIDKVFSNALSGVYPEGVNIVTEFIREMIGLPYGDNGMSLDYKTDCSQLVINVLRYFFNEDDLGSYTQSIYNSPDDIYNIEDGTVYYDWKVQSPRTGGDYIQSAPVLSVILYKFADRNPDATHAAIKVSSSQIAHTRSTSKPLMFDKLTYSLTSITQIRDFLTPEMHASVIVGSIENPDWTGVDDSKKNTEVITVGNMVLKYTKMVYTGVSHTNFRSSPTTFGNNDIGDIKNGEHVYVIRTLNEEWLNIVNKDGVVGFCANRRLFKKV